MMKMKKFLVGKRISLHGLRSEDLKEGAPYYEWLDDLSLDLYTERSYFPNNPARMADYYNRACQNRDLLLLGIYDNETGKHVGNITLSDINWINRNAYIAYLLGDKTVTGRGYVTDACIMLMYYGFTKLNLERIHGGVSSRHPASQRVCEKVGLIVEGRRRNHLYRNGEFSDDIIVGALRHEWMEEYGKRAREIFETLPTY